MKGENQMNKVYIFNKYNEESYYLNLTDEQLKLLDYLNNICLLDEQVIYFHDKQEDIEFTTLSK